MEYFDAKQKRELLSSFLGHLMESAQDPNGDTDRCFADYTLAEAIQFAIECIDLQIPAIVNIEPWSPAYCPNCNTELSKHHGDGIYSYPTHQDRCWNCTQKLKWERNQDEISH